MKILVHPLCRLSGVNHKQVQFWLESYVDWSFELILDGLDEFLEEAKAGVLVLVAELREFVGKDSLVSADWAFLLVNLYVWSFLDEGFLMGGKSEEEVFSFWFFSLYVFTNFSTGVFIESKLLFNFLILWRIRLLEIFFEFLPQISYLSFFQIVVSIDPCVALLLDVQWHL